MKKKLLATLGMAFIAALSLGMFVGCNDSNPDTGKENPPLEEPSDEEEPKGPTEGLEYTRISGKAEYACSSKGSATATDIIIAATYGDYPVTQIAAEAFKECERLTSVAIPDSVTRIGDDAFSKCSNLTSVTMPKNLTRIGESAFYRCSKLTSIAIPDSVTDIDRYAFMYCEKLETVTLPDSLYSFGEKVFGDCSNLKYNEYENGLYLGSKSNQYFGLAKIKDTSITTFQPHTATKALLYDAFDQCEKLKSVVLSNGLTYIGIHSFSSCSDALTEVTIPASVKRIDDYAFMYCDKLKDINFKGTKSQWSDMSRSSYWDRWTGNYTVHCTNGDY